MAKKILLIHDGGGTFTHVPPSGYAPENQVFFTVYSLIIVMCSA